MERERKRESPLDSFEANTRKLELVLTKIRAVDCRTLRFKTRENMQYHKGWQSSNGRARILPETILDTMWPATATKRLLDTGTEDAPAGLAKDHVAQRQRLEQKRPVQQESSSASGVQRSSANDEATRRADAEAEKALKRARFHGERRAAKRASATSVHELEESTGTETGASNSSAALMVATDAVLAEIRETLMVLTVSALQQHTPCSTYKNNG